MPGGMQVSGRAMLGEKHSSSDRIGQCRGEAGVSPSYKPFLGRLKGSRPVEISFLTYRQRECLKKFLITSYQSNYLSVEFLFRIYSIFICLLYFCWGEGKEITFLIPLSTSAFNLIDIRAARDLKDCLIQSPYFTDEETHLYKG